MDGSRPSTTTADAPPADLIENSLEAVSEVYDCWVTPSHYDEDDESCMASLFLEEETEEDLEETRLCGEKKRPRPVEDEFEDVDDDQEEEQDDDDDENEDDEEEEEQQEEDILVKLKKRCPSYMLPPPVPAMRRRKRPNCIFVNYLGTRQYPHNSSSFAPKLTVSYGEKGVFPTSTPSDPPVVAPSLKHKQERKKGHVPFLTQYSPRNKPTIAPTPAVTASISLEC